MERVVRMLDLQRQIFLEHLIQVSLHSALVDCILVAEMDEQIAGEAIPEGTKRLGDLLHRGVLGSRRRRSLLELLPHAGTWLAERARPGLGEARPRGPGDQRKDAANASWQEPVTR